MDFCLFPTCYISTTLDDRALMAVSV